MFLKVSRKIINDNLNMKIIMYVVYHCLQNDEKTFNKLKIKIRIDISKFYKNLISLSYFLIEFNAELFNFDRHFLMTMKTSFFSVIENVIVNR